MTVTAFLPAALSAGRPLDPVAPPSISQQTGFQTTTTATNGVSNVLNHLGNITSTVDSGVTEGQGDGPGFLRATIDPADKRWQTFTTYDYGHLDVEGATGIQSDTNGGSIGVLYRVCPSFAFGGSVGGLYSKGILAAGAGDVRTDGFSMAAFGVATWGNTFADLIYSATLLDSQFARTAAGTNATGQADSTVHSIGLTVGHNLRFGRWTTGPRLGLNYSHWSQKSYTENGAGALLAYPDQNTESLVTRVEWFGSYDIKTRYGLLVPRAQLGWHRETMGGAGTSNVGVVGGGVAAGAGGVNRVRHYMMAGAGVSLNFSENWKASVDYVGQFFAANFEVHNVSLMLSYGF
jgi:uncharacterized protein YhjY with autotransporter beta-barrel domain